MNVVSDDEREAVADRVQQLLAGGLLQPNDGIASVPLPVHRPDGAIHSWVVPFLAGRRLVAWAQLSRSLDLLRFSMLAGAVDASDWLDPNQIAKKVAGSAGEGSILALPMLTYDRDPSRLVWEVKSSAPGEELRRWFVAGDSVWEDTGDDEVTGGSVED